VKRHTSSVAVAALVLAGSLAAFAQDTQQGQPAPAAATPADEAEEIIVTGSRIKRADLVASSPVSVVDSTELSLTTTVSVEDVLREMPQALPGITTGVNNGNPGVATVNLRNLDDERTLVLVNGKRMIGYDSEGIVDLNNIPTPLIERVDIVTGGASAVYGSDAIAGVVNFVLKDDFEGVQVDFNYDNALRGGETTKNFTVTLGGNFADERGNATLFAGWTDREPVSQGNRWFSERAITTASGGFGGSSTDTNGNILCIPSCRGPGGSFGPQTFVGFASANGDLQPRGSRRFNFNPFNLLRVPQERYQASFLGHYDLTEWLTAYAEGHYSQQQVDTVIAPSGTFFSTFDIPFDSIYLTPQAQLVIFDRDGDGVFDASFDSNGDGSVGAGDVASVGFGRRTIEIGPRITRNRTQAYQVLVGVKGDIPFLDGWDYDVSIQHGRTELSRVFENDLAGERVQDVLTSSSPFFNPGAVEGGTCFSGAAAGCVVGSLFGDGSLSSATASYIALQINEEIYTTMDVATASVSGNLGETVKVPGASPIEVAFGAEWRQQKSESFPDDCYSTPDCSIGFGSTSPVSGEYNVKEVFFETIVPLLENRPFLESLKFEGAYRYADYSTAGGVSAWRVGGDYAPGEFLDGLRLRVNYQEAVRAPNIFELFFPVTPGLDNAAGDPCAGFAEQNGGVPDPVTQFVRDQCVADGAPATAFTPIGGGLYATAVPDVIAGQINIYLGGNPDLGEETSHTLTVGGVYQAPWLEGLTLTVDWYRVDIDEAISSVLASDVLAACYDPAVNALCNLIQRNPLTGGLVGGPEAGIFETEQNISTLEVSGVDFGVQYDLDLGNAGHVDFDFVGTHVLQYDYRSSSISRLNKCAGTFGSICDPPNPTLRTTLSATWYIGDFLMRARWRYISDTEGDSSLDTDGDGVLDACIKPFCTINNTHYLDFVVGWTPSETGLLGGLEVQVGIENVFDEDPPIVGQEAGTTTQNSGNTYPGAYDTIGRTLTLSLTKKF
jgi:outer membrane receptor protein involved in Fe transport